MNDGPNRVRMLAPDEDHDARKRPGWLPLVVLLVLGAIGAALLAQGSTGTAEIAAGGDPVEALFTTDGETTTTFETPDTTTTAPPQPSRIRDLMPSFRGKLVLVGRDGGETYHGEWLDGWSSPNVVAAPASMDRAILDVRANELATLAFHSSSQGVLFTSRDPVAPLSPSYSPVNSMAWHETEAGLLAWTGWSPGNELPTLFIGELPLRLNQNLTVTQSIADVPPDTEVVAWGTWGFLVSNGPFLWSLDPDGELVAVVAGSLVASDTGGQFLIESNDAQPSVIDSLRNYFGPLATPLTIPSEKLVIAPGGTYLGDTTLEQLPNTRTLAGDTSVVFVPGTPFVVSWDRPGDAVPALIDMTSLRQARIDMMPGGALLDITPRYLLYQSRPDELVLLDMTAAASAILEVDGQIIAARILDR
ncbi:MAG: hypothetical protein HKN07_09025 [Acidimicrobiia bacterium]|nr:hypothetical protein [Acidimicrobiia bacterium]